MVSTFNTHLLELGQTLLAAQRFVAVLHRDREPFVAAAATVLTDRQVVHVAETMKTGIAAQLVDDALQNDLMLALREDEPQTDGCLFQLI